MAPIVTIGFSLHRPEMVPLMAGYMRKHDALFLEEPPTVEFERMLSGSIPLDEYVMMVDSEYPQFTKLMCAALREFKSSGKDIFQVDPMEIADARVEMTVFDGWMVHRSF